MRAILSHNLYCLTASASSALRNRCFLWLRHTSRLTPTRCYPNSFHKSGRRCFEDEVAKWAVSYRNPIQMHPPGDTDIITADLHLRTMPRFVAKTKMEIGRDNTAVLLIAHGSRRSEANDDLVKLAQLISERATYPIVEVSYLELTSPTIPDGGKACVDKGARRVLMLPYFLSAGVHVVNDLKEFCQQLNEAFPDVEFVLCPHLGLHPLMADIVLARLQEGVTA